MSVVSNMTLSEAEEKIFGILAVDNGYDNLEEFNTEWEGSYSSSGLWQEFMDAGMTHTVDGLTATVVTEYGGEGKGDQYWMVVSLSDGETTRYFRKDGWYASYDGGSLDGETYEVFPKEKVVVEYV